ncbi:MFS transporter [Aquisalimonas asiatica]|uniref:Predicted arabinose efflux permease, MFS family n=1 Tax=Aquisalimonas asiatica TaxID=406100 RepID=A0A1H8SVG0_9GAMM|nr:MFS transporter [Aquisalimonas asiatica]SEO82183.1 Predicted arabinose efflux permease, MFS family [Aquisalimonas asiatica]
MTTGRAAHPRRYLVFALFAAGFLLSYVLRGVNVAFEEKLASGFGLESAAVGAVTASFFLAFALVQPLVGYLLDRIGPRRTQSLLLIVAAVGAAVFALAAGLAGLMTGRVLLGIGLAASLTAGYKAIAEVFPAAQVPLFNGLLASVGSLGVVLVGTPLDALLYVLDWRQIMGVLGAIALVLTVLLWLLVPEPPRTPAGQESADGPGLFGYMADPRYWSILPLGILNQSMFLAMQTLWLMPFLRQTMDYSRGEAAMSVSVVGVALIFGGVGLGALASWMLRFRIEVAVTAGIAMSLFPLVQTWVLLQGEAVTQATWFLFGVTGGSGMVLYAVFARTFPGSMLGRLSTTYTLGVFLGTFLLQAAYGWLLDLGQAAGRTPEEAHVGIWALLIALQVVAVACYWGMTPARRRRAAAAYRHP